MEPITLQEAKDEKIREVRELAELSYWDVFIDHPNDVPILAMGYITLGSILGGQLTQVSRQKAQEARSVVERLRTLCDQIQAATTVEQVQAFFWDGGTVQAARAK